MSHAAILEAFPRRPIALVPDPGADKARRLWLVALVLLLVPGFYWGWSLWQDQQLREYLRAQGVEAEVLSAEGNCWSRRQISGNNPRGCNLAIEYRLRPEHGGEVRRANVWLDGARPIFTPPALYDPANPSRVMLRPEAQRDLRWTEWIAVPVVILIPAAGLLLWFLSRKDPWVEALADPKPVAVPIERFVRQGNVLQLWFRKEAGNKELLQVFPAGTDPFLLPPPAGATEEKPWALALLGAGGRPLVLDADMRKLALSEEERRRILASV